MRRVFDTTFDYKTDDPRGARPDADRDSKTLREDHELLWSKKLPLSEAIFAPKVTPGKNEYLIFTDATGDRFCYGSDAITSSYTDWVKAKRPRSRALVEAIAGLNPEQRARYLDPPYTIGSAMIWPVRRKDYHTVNRVRGRNILIADRMDLTLECIQLHYAGKAGHPLEKATTAYKDFFDLFGTFKAFVEFFHFQDLIKPGSDYQEIEYFLKPNNFERAATPATTGEYIEYRENVLAFIKKRSIRMANWVMENRRDIAVRQ
ncbi:hypothetical protein NicSoilB4_21060 [Arthrobacter sp. NicSoilB4]|uniref:DUF6994 family protein n=1 Tax=Arthrobacter sp. NicSoilB4 TaxID=2830997 RepID=UPI001CC5BAA5|nr:hypothetical protein [Arthrobacter sp. NicSoilB4]BCW67343.1 hypothetical protein NicSoilB4_21060 [Arthrobacter sp. NicSoilB4]